MTLPFSAWALAAWGLAALPILSLTIYSIEVVLGLVPPRPSAPINHDAAFAILIPAHNEEAGIADTLTALKAHLPDHARILVVADNCTDATADKVRALGIEVVERHDPEHRGKGYALDFGRAALSNSPPDTVIILDADCRMLPGSATSLANAAKAYSAPVQGINLLSARPDHAPMVQVSNFAFLVKNLIRQRGISRLGGAAPLGGTGMALPWSLFAKMPLASGNIVEDINLAIDCAKAGAPARFLESARVESPPASAKATIDQRSRWEHGFINAARASALPALFGGLRDRRWPQFWLGLHLLVPPLTLLILISALVWVVEAALGWATGYWNAAIALSWALMITLSLTLMAWALYGRTILSLRALVRAPLYILWKIPVYARLLLGKTAAWTRTTRSSD